MALIIIWLFFMLCCTIGAMDTPVMQFLFVSFLVVVTAGGLFGYAIVSEDERKKAKKKKARLRRKKQIQKEEAQRQKRQSKESQKLRRKDEKEFRKRRRKEKKQEKKSQRLALRQAKKDFFIYRRLIEKDDKLQKKLQKKLDEHNRKEVMIAQPIQIHFKTKRDKSKPIKLTSFILSVIVFVTMMSCIVGTQVIFAQNQNSHVPVITDYYYIGYDDSS